jgi:hypothetical protein
MSAFVHQHDAGLVLAAYQNFDTPGDDNFAAVANAVQCTDAPFPQQWNLVAPDYWRTYRVAPFATWNNAWFNGPCLFWPVVGGRAIAVDGHAVRALLVGETLDAGAPFEGSIEVRRRFTHSSLLAEPGGTTHAGTLFGNACVDGHIANYLATGILPPRRSGDGPDAFCAPFPEPNASASPSTPRQATRLRLRGLVR